jgi:hypothetical protein
MVTKPPGPALDFKWVIDARADIQAAMLALYQFDSRNRERLLTEDDDVHRGVLGLLVGASFSLWRAAFLSGIEREWKDVLNDATDLLREVLTSNAVSFPTELRLKDWMFGYYLNNALYRTADARTKLGIASDDLTFEAFDTLQRDGLVGTKEDPKDQWDNLLGAPPRP